MRGRFLADRRSKVGAAGHIGSATMPRMSSRFPLRAWTVVFALAPAVLLAACGSSASGDKASSTSSATKVVYAGAENKTPSPAPALRLRDSLGQDVDIGSFHGKAVLVTFVYTHCPDVCPLIVGNFHTALAQLGPKAQDVQIVAVSTDPKGDTPASVKRFLRQHQMTGKMKYLLGSPSQLQAVWKTWNIQVRRSKQTPELVEHAAPIYGIGASGKILTLYPSNYKPAWLVHDVPLLATH
jgi:protein SCO1